MKIRINLYNEIFKVLRYNNNGRFKANNGKIKG